jgi:Flp pilus assembly CpaE family ATPase
VRVGAAVAGGALLLVVAVLGTAGGAQAATVTATCASTPTATVCLGGAQPMGVRWQ